MSIWGKIIGGAAGLALGGPLGAILGTAAGHAVDRLTDAATAPADGASAEKSKKEVAFTIAVIVLGAKMAKADGVVTDDEIRAFREVFRVPQEEEAKVTLVFNIARRDHRGFEPYARQIAKLFRNQPAVLEELLSCLFHIAKADGTVEAAELEFLHGVAMALGLNEADFHRIRAEEIGPDAGDPYHILGVDRSQSDEQIKAAFRTLVRGNHPDRLIAQGMPQEFVDVANEKVATINAAYDRIKQERGLN